jgi:hypothetical membrane protein
MLSIVTSPILFGVDALTLAGFVVIGVSVGLRRAQKLQRPIAISLEIVGGVLVVVGVFTAQTGG